MFGGRYFLPASASAVVEGFTAFALANHGNKLGRGTKERREETEEQAAQRLEKMRGAVRTLLECIGEDPDREGLLDTPSRYAKALLFLTNGYQVNLEETTNQALFHEGHSELVIVKDIEIYRFGATELTHT